MRRNVAAESQTSSKNQTASGIGLSLIFAAEKKMVSLAAGESERKVETLARAADGVRFKTDD